MTAKRAEMGKRRRRFTNWSWRYQGRAKLLQLWTSFSHVDFGLRRRNARPAWWSPQPPAWRPTQTWFHVARHLSYALIAPQGVDLRAHPSYHIGTVAPISPPKRHPWFAAFLEKIQCVFHGLHPDGGLIINRGLFWGSWKQGKFGNTGTEKVAAVPYCASA